MRITLNRAQQMAEFGVTVNTLSPGLVATARNQWRRDEEQAWGDIQFAGNPMHRAGTPDEIAGAALLLCSEAGSFIISADVQTTGGGHLSMLNGVPAGWTHVTLKLAVEGLQGPTWDAAIVQGALDGRCEVLLTEDMQPGMSLCPIIQPPA